jgi:putative transposase
LPAEYHAANLRRAELTWRAEHDELCLTIDTGEVLLAAVTTTRRHVLLVSGRQLRSCKQWRNKVHSVLQENLRRCQPGSRRSRRLTKRKAQVSAKLYRQQRDLLH